MRPCLVHHCIEEASARRRVCRMHWQMLPGRMRSRLSLTAGFGQTARADAAWDRARRWLEENGA